MKDEKISITQGDLIVSSKPIKFLKIRNVKSPNRSYKYDAGIDFFVPEFDKNFVTYLEENNPQNFKKETSNNFTLTSGTLTIADRNSDFVSYDSPSSCKNDEDYWGFDREVGESYFILKPHNRVMIPSGILCRMSIPGRALIAANKSGVATKLGLVFGAQVVDYTYKGEIHMSVINTSTKNVKIFQNMKLLQFVETPVYNSKVDVTEYTFNDPENINAASYKFHLGMENDRGTGGFGSTDKKDGQKH